MLNYNIPNKHDNIQSLKQIVKFARVNRRFNRSKHILKCLDILLYYIARAHENHSHNNNRLQIRHRYLLKKNKDVF